MKKKRIDFETFAEIKLPCNVSVNENGVFFVMKTADLKKNRYDLELCRLENGQEKPLAAIGSPSYWHCDDKLVYVEKQDDKKQADKVFPETVLRSVTYDGRTRREYARLDYAVDEIVFINEDEFYFTASCSRSIDAALAENKGNRRKAEKQLIADRDYMVFTEIPFWSNGVGVTNGVRSRLFRWKSGEVTPITDDMTDVGGLCPNVDRSRIVFTSARREDKYSLYNRLYCLEPATGNVTDITSCDELDHSRCGFLRDGKLVFAASKTDKYGLNQNSDLYIYDFASGEVTLLCEGRDYGFYPSVGSDISAGRSMPNPFYEGPDKIYTITTENDRTPIIGIDRRTGAIEKFSSLPGLVSEAVLWGDNFYLVAHRGMSGPEIYRMDAAGNETQLSWLNSFVNLDYELSEPQPLCFDNERGDKIYGFAIPPVGCQKGQKYKTVLAVHGGPRTAYGSNLFHEMQLLAARGYAVIYCNPTGSDGRGDAFADIRGKYGDIDFRDLMTFCDQCAERVEFVDGANMAIIGGSYGGFMTNWAIGHTDRFKAAVSQRSIANWSSFCGTSDIGDYFGPDQTAADIWTAPEKMWEQSPLKYADKVKTPTLFIHSDSDYRCPLVEGVSMFSALKRFGVPSRICVFKGENHELSRSGKPVHRVRRLKEMVAWLDKYLV